MLEKTRQRKVSKRLRRMDSPQIRVCYLCYKLQAGQSHPQTCHDSEVKNNWPIMNDESNFGLSTCLAALRVGPTLTKGFRRFGAVLNHELT